MAYSITLLCGSVREKLPLCFLICLQFKLSARDALRRKKSKRWRRSRAKKQAEHMLLARVCERVRLPVFPPVTSVRNLFSLHSRGAGAGCFSQWDGNTLPIPEPQLRSSLGILNPNLHSGVRPPKRADLTPWLRSAQLFRMVSLLFCCSASWDRTSIAVLGSPRGGWGISAGLSLQSWELIK